MREAETVTSSVPCALAAAQSASKLTELRRNSVEYLPAMIPPLIELDDARFGALLSELGFPLDGREAMQPHVILQMICWDGAKGAAQEQFKGWIDR